MRRKDREIVDKNEVVEIIKKCDVCNVAFHDKVYPYVIPLSFGFTFVEGAFVFYFHGASVGKKMDLRNDNAEVGFSMNCSHRLVEGKIACEYTMCYESVCGNGELCIIEGEEKQTALTSLMKQYVQDKAFDFTPAQINGITIMKLSVHSISAKRSIG